MKKRLGLSCVGFLVLLAGGVASAQEKAPVPPKPGPEVKKLEWFAGQWNWQGEMRPGPWGAGGKFNSSENCAWGAGGFAMVCRSTFKGGMGSGSEISVMSYDKENKNYVYHAVNSNGEVVNATGQVSGDTWAWNGESKMGGKVVKGKFTLKQDSPNSASAKYEASVDGGPINQHMEAKSTRVTVKKAPAAPKP